MYNTTNEESIQETVHVFTETEEGLCEKVCGWLTTQITNNSNVDENKIEKFTRLLMYHLSQSFINLHCANIRTTRSNSKLYTIAKSAGIDTALLPKDISIIINSHRAYYYHKDSSIQNFIA